MPDSIRLATSKRARDVAAEDRRRQSVFGVVGDAHRLVHAVDAHDRRRPGRTTPRHRCASPSVTLIDHRGRHQRALDLRRRRPRRAPLPTASSIKRLDAARGLRADQRAERRRCPCADRRRPAIRPWPRALSTKASATFSSTTIRSVDMQIWPWFMKAPNAAASTASSRSASSSTISGALPPSSSSDRLEIFRRRSAR